MDRLIKFFSEVGKLRFLKRKWDVRGVAKEDAESSADHAFRVALMAWALGTKENLDLGIIIKMALIHDLCNVYVGETTPYDKVLTGDPQKDQVILRGLPRFSKEQKEEALKERREKEEAAFDKLLNLVSNKSFAHEIKELWLDYEFVRTPEARFVRQVDRIEPLLQAVEYKEEEKIDDITVYWYQAKEWVDFKNLQEFVHALDDHLYVKRQQKSNKKAALVSR